MVKLVGYNPANVEGVGLPTILSTISLYDVNTGHLRALCDGTFPTALRTGAASAVASRLLAHPDSRVLGLPHTGIRMRIVTDAFLHKRQGDTAARERSLADEARNKLWLTLGLQGFLAAAYIEYFTGLVGIPRGEWYWNLYDKLCERNPPPCPARASGASCPW